MGLSILPGAGPGFENFIEDTQDSLMEFLFLWDTDKWEIVFMQISRYHFEISLHDI